MPLFRKYKNITLGENELIKAHSIPIFSKGSSICLNERSLTIFRMVEWGWGRGQGKKAPPTSFPPVTFANIDISL